MIKTFTKAMDATTYAIVSLGLSNFTTDAKFIGSIDEFRIFDGAALHTNDFTPPTAAEYAAMSAPATATFDVEVRYTNRSESGFWRYENPGSGDYIFYHDNITTEAVSYDKSVTGVAFWGGDQLDMCNVPAGCKELWIRLDIWLSSSVIPTNADVDFYFGSSTNNASTPIAGYQVNSWVTPAERGHCLGIRRNSYYPSLALAGDTRNSIVLSVRSGSTDGVIQGTLGGNTETYTGDVNGGNDFTNVFFQSTKNYALFSNIVVSNAPLTLEDGWHREPVAVEMNIKAPDLCVRKNGTTYTVPFATTQDPPADSVVARLGGQMIYNPLVATDNANASVIKTRYNGNNRALSASFG